MKTRNVMETLIICVAGVSALAIVASTGSGGLDGWSAFAIVAAAAVFGGFRYLTSKSAHRLELTGSQQYRDLAEEYRRLSDLAITAQEHADLKLGDVSAQLDYLREQVTSLQKILSDVE